MPSEEHIKELEISTFSKPILKEMGVKAIFLLIFDVILGPIAYINRISTEKSEYLDFLRDLAHLGEFYTGISFAKINKVTTQTGEEMIVGRTTRKVGANEFIDVAVALVESTEYEEEIVKLLKFAVRTSYGNPKNFSTLIDKICLEYQDIGKRKTDVNGKIAFKDLSAEKQSNVAKIFHNWNGVLFVDFESDRLNSSFLPDWIEANKIDPMDIAQKVRQMYAQGIILPRAKQSFTMVSLKSRQAIVISSSNLRFSTIVFPTQVGLTRINYIVSQIETLIESLVNVGLNFHNETMKTTLETMDIRVTKKKEEALMTAVVELMVKADTMMPKGLISNEEYESLEGELQKKFFAGFGKAFQEFDGKKTIMEINHKMKTTLELMADFVVFCKTRGIVQVFTKNGRKR